MPAGTHLPARRHVLGRTPRSPTSTRRLQFYGGLFGWEFDGRAAAGGAGPRTSSRSLDGRDVAALSGPADGDRRPGTTYVAVDDADAAAAALQWPRRRRRRRRPRMPDPGGRRRRRCATPRASRSACGRPRRRLGVQAANEPGRLELQRPAHPDPARRGGVLRARRSAGGSWTRARRPPSRCPATATTSRPPSTPTSAPARPAAPTGFEDVIGGDRPGDAGERPALARHLHRRRPRRVRRRGRAARRRGRCSSAEDDCDPQRPGPRSRRQPSSP